MWSDTVLAFIISFRNIVDHCETEQQWPVARPRLFTTPSETTWIMAREHARVRCPGMQTSGRADIRL